MSCPIISRLVDIKGADAMAGSMLILLKNKGRDVPINVATMMLHKREIETIEANIKSCFVISRLNVKSNKAKMMPIPVPIRSSFNIIFRLLCLYVSVAKPLTIIADD